MASQHISASRCRRIARAAWPSQEFGMPATASHVSWPTLVRWLDFCNCFRCCQMMSDVARCKFSMWPTLTHPQQAWFQCKCPLDILGSSWIIWLLTSSAFQDLLITQTDVTGLEWEVLNGTKMYQVLDFFGINAREMCHNMVMMAALMAWLPLWYSMVLAVLSQKSSDFPRYKFFDRTQLEHTNRTELTAQQVFVRRLECLIHHLRDQWFVKMQGRIESYL